MSFSSLDGEPEGLELVCVTRDRHELIRCAKMGWWRGLSLVHSLSGRAGWWGRCGCCRWSAWCIYRSFLFERVASSFLLVLRWAGISFDVVKEIVKRFYADFEKCRW
jgi:hypothetical protein